MGNLKICIVLDSLQIDTYVDAFTHWAADYHAIELTSLLVIPPSSHRIQRHTVKTGLAALSTFLSGQAARATAIVEEFLIRFFSSRKRRICQDHLIRSVLHLNSGVPTIHVGSMDELDIGKGASATQIDVDLIVNLSTSTLPRSLVQIARLGSVRIAYGDGTPEWSALAGFWEAYHRDAKTTFYIKREAPTSETEETLVVGSFRTQFSFLLNQAHLYRKSYAQLQQMIANTAVTGRVADAQRNVSVLERAQAEPSAAHLMMYLQKLLFRMGVKAARRTLNIKEKWGVQVVESDWDNADMSLATRIHAPSGRFWADPFLYVHEGRTFCFIEDYVYAADRAHISVLELSDGKAAYIGKALEEDHHLSFPFIFKYRGDLYMCPEASESGQIRIYKSTRFPLGWEFCTIAMKNISAADSMFFEHQGKWWLLTSVDRSGFHDHCSELCLFYADSPLAEEWTPHPRNPIYLDSEGGRNAGLILEDGKIFRGAQSQGFDRYGEGLSIYKIVKLDETTYEEVKVKDIKRARNMLLGTHHISTTGRITAMDFLTLSLGQ